MFLLLVIIRTHVQPLFADQQSLVSGYSENPPADILTAVACFAVLLVFSENKGFALDRNRIRIIFIVRLRIARVAVRLWITSVAVRL